MITMKQWMDLVGYKITEGSDYGWKCYGNNSYSMSCWNGVHGDGGHNADIVFSTKTQRVYEVTVCDYANNRAYRMINPSHTKRHDKEAVSRSVLANQAWDDVDYVDLEVVEDFLQKAKAILAGTEYDTRVQVPLTLDDDHMFELMKLAHDRDLTLNRLVETILQDAINDPAKFKDVAVQG